MKGIVWLSWLLGGILGQTGQATEIITIQLTTPQKMCAEIQCVVVGPGEIGVYRWPAQKNPLAYGTLAEDTKIAGVTVSAGQKIAFDDPGQKDFYGTNFWVQSPKKIIEQGGVHLQLQQKVGYQRFRFVWNTQKMEWEWVPRPNGEVTVSGRLSQSEKLEGITLASDTAIRFETTIDNLSNGQIAKLRLIFGEVAERFLLPAIRPIELLKGDVISLSDRIVDLSRIHTSVRVIQPEGFKVRRVVYSRQTGLPTYAILEEKAKIDGLNVLGDVSFFPNGKMRKAELSQEEQSLNGLRFDGSITYYGEVQFYENGNALAITSVEIAANARYLPDTVVKTLPKVLKPEEERVRFFLNPDGEVRALVVEAMSWNGKNHWEEKVFTASEANGKLRFTELGEQDKLSHPLKQSTRGSINGEVLKYLLQH